MRRLINATLSLFVFGIVLRCAESQPAFTASTLTASLAENSAAGTTVTTLAITGFSTPNAAVVALGTEAPAVTGAPWFEVAGMDVKVKSAITVNYEDAALTSDPKQITIVVTAEHSGDTESATATVTITITDVAPTLNVGLTADLEENSGVGTAVTTVGPTGAGIAFTLGTITPNDDYFEIATAASGAMTVKTGATIDYEAVSLTTKKYEIQVIATEGGETTTATATITILDIPEFNAGTLTKDQPENTAAEASITTVTTTTTGATFTILAQAPDHGMFAISTAGVVSLAPSKILDYENADVAAASREYKITVKATHPSNTKTATATLTVTVQDTPDFSSGLTATLEENSAAATDVSTVVTDPVDAVLASGTQTGNLAWFQVSSSTRKVTIAASKVVDYENNALTSHKYTVVLTATKDGKTGTATLTVTITDVAESGTAVLAGSVMAAVFLLLSLRIV